VSRRTRNTTTSPQPGRVPATVPQPEPVAQPTEHDTAQTTSCDDAVSDHDASRQAQADAIAASAGGYALLYSAVDGWELYHGDELLAGHDGIEAGDVDQAKAWATGQLAGELGDGQRATVAGWSTRPCRHDPGSVEHVAEVAPAALRPEDLDAGTVTGPDGLPPLPDLLAELAGLGELAATRRVHEVIRTLGGTAVAVQQEYRNALCPTYMRRSDWKSALAEAKQQATADESDKAERGPSQAEILAGMARRSYSFHTTPDGEPYALPLGGPRIARPLRGGRTGLRAELSAAYLTEYRRPPSSNALADTLGAIEGLCAEGECLPMHVRVAEADGAWWLDLGRRDGLAVRIDATGWETTTDYPVVFRRTGLTGELPMPVAGGDLAELRKLLNVADEVWPLVVAWLVSCLHPSMPHPIIGLTGEQGTGKTTAAKYLVRTIDESSAPIRSAPRDLETWAITASASWALAIDNVRSLPDWLSDALCRAVTGDALPRRKLWTDADVYPLSFRRCVVMTSIHPGALEADLADRLLAIELALIADDQRREDTEIAEAWPKAHPQILGGLLDLAVAVRAVLPTVRPPRLPRMADYARLLAAVDQVLGTDGLATYTGQRQALAGEVIDGDPVAKAIADYITTVTAWTGTAGELLAQITTRLKDPDRPPRGWPKTARGLGGTLKRTAPALRAIGISVIPHGHGRAGSAWTLSTTNGLKNGGTQPSPPSPPSPDRLWPAQTARDGWPHERDGWAMGAGQPSQPSPPSGQPSPPPHDADQHQHPAGDGRDRRDGSSLPTLNPRPSGTCRACGEPIDPTAGDTHPSCPPPICPDCGWTHQSLGHQINCEGLDTP